MQYACKIVIIICFCNKSSILFFSTCLRLAEKFNFLLIFMVVLNCNFRTYLGLLLGFINMLGNCFISFQFIYDLYGKN